MKKKAMLSQPMGRKTEEEIVATRERAVNLPMNGTRRRKWLSVESSRFLFVSWLSLLRTCLSAMLRISVKDGNPLVDAGLNMLQLKPMGWISYMRMMNNGFKR